MAESITANLSAANGTKRSAPSSRASDQSKMVHLMAKADQPRDGHQHPSRELLLGSVDHQCLSSARNLRPFASSTRTRPLRSAQQRRQSSLSSCSVSCGCATFPWQSCSTSHGCCKVSVGRSLGTRSRQGIHGTDTFQAKDAASSTLKLCHFQSSGLPSKL